MDDRDFEVGLTTWAAGGPQLAAVRRAVFVEEQHIPESLEWDEHDAPSVHGLATDATGHPIGTARLLPDGRIGRMAVIAAWRGRGVGRALLDAMVREARRRGHQRCRLDAQVTAIGFYERAGFVAHGPVFDDAGIPHRAMTLRFDTGSQAAAPTS